MTLAEEIERAKDRSEAQLAEQINAIVPATELDVATIALINPFIEFCVAVGVRHAPAKPTTIAGYILHLASVGTPKDRILDCALAVEALHDHYRLANPVATAAARHVLGQVLQVEPPRSWTKTEQLMFHQLPPEIKAAVQRRCADQEKALRRAQNEAAELRHQQTAADPKPVNETTEKDTKMAKKNPGEGPYHNNDGDPIAKRIPVAPLSLGKDISKKVDDASNTDGGFSGGLSAKGE